MFYKKEKPMNKVQLIGHLGGDVELKYTSDGKAVVNLSVATKTAWNNKETKQRESSTQWHRVVIFGKLAEVAAKYLHKGSHVFIEGSLRTRKWTDKKDNIDRWTTEVVLSGYQSTLTLLDKKPESGTQTQTQTPVVSQDDVAGATNQVPDDDIPF
jgi:single-strand DNA-binding protein